MHIRWTARWLPDSQMRLAVAHDMTEAKRIQARQAAVYAIAKAAHAATGLQALFAQVHQTIGELLDARNFAACKKRSAAAAHSDAHTGTEAR